ncbi:MAG: AAA family ATPase [Candidatus Thiothrix moscowensis]|nr:AAA family ATPase [Candidatus Thiothrix moscowensis]
MLDSLHIKNFRCFEDLTIPSLGRVNLIVGKNSVGKSSILEAIYIFANRGNRTAIMDILSSRNEFFRTDDIIKDIFFNRECPNKNKDDNNLTIGNGEDRNFVYISCDKENHEYIKTGFQNESDPFLQEALSLKERLIFRSEAIPCSIVHTDVRPEDDLAFLWDEVSINSEEDSIKEALKIITPKLVNIIFVKSPQENKQERIAIVKLKGESKGIPLKSFGEGMSRLLQIFLHSFQARGGFLLIDEFENGLHYSIQEDVWEKLFNLAKELDIQIFATTHSEDTIKAFCKVALASEEEGRLIALGRSPAPEDNNRIVAISYDEKEIAVISRTGMEVR